MVTDRSPALFLYILSAHSDRQFAASKGSLKTRFVCVPSRDAASRFVQ